MEPLINTKQAAELIGVSVASMKLYRAKGTGPVFVRIGHKTVRYTAESLRAWVASRESASVRDQDGAGR